MNVKIVFCLGLALFVMAAEVSGHKCSKCGTDGGYDACGCSEALFKSVNVEKPVFGGSRVICKKTKGVEEFKPMGDMCGLSCGKVRPAVVPKPACYKKGKASLESYEVYEEKPEYVVAPRYLHDFGDSKEEIVETHTNEETLLPVDAVSMNLVQAMQRTAATSKTDEKLFYGFTSLPQEKPTIRNKDNVPEENLYTFERRIVELKPQQHVVKYGEGEDSDVVVNENGKPAAYLSYGDLGYTPVSGAPSKFIKKCQHSVRDQYRDQESEERYSSYEEKKYYKRGSSEEEEIREGSDEEEEYKYPCKKRTQVKEVSEEEEVYPCKKRTLIKRIKNISCGC